MTRIFIPSVLLAGVISLQGATALAQTSKPAAAHPDGLDPGGFWKLARQQWGTVRPPEALEMLLSIARGGQMGPGDGWFHPSRSRYHWDWLAAKFDADHDGKITREELRGPAEFYERLDRNRDGVIKAEDLDWSDRSNYARQAMPASQWFRMFDANSNGRVSPDEWQKLFERAAKGKGYLTAEDLRDAFPTAPPPRLPGAATAASKEGPTTEMLFQGLMKGELGSFREGPSLNEQAPDFTLKTPDGKQAITLSKYRGQKPVVLIFGSFT